MKKLLVAIDFSPASKSAFEFAARLSIQLKLSLTAIHVAAPIKNISETVDTSLVAKMEEKENAQLAAQLRRFTTIYPESGAEALTASPRPKCLVRRGDAAKEILQTALKEEMAMIVIGTKAKHTIWQQVFGSLTTALISESPISILIIPEKNKVETVKNIAYATAVNLEEEEVLPSLFHFAEGLGATIHPFYVNSLKSERFKFKEEGMNTNWRLEDSPGVVTMIREKSVIDGIAYFLEKYPNEILSLYVPKRAFFEQIFHRSLSKQIAYSTRIPLLICKKSEAVDS